MTCQKCGEINVDMYDMRDFYEDQIETHVCRDCYDELSELDDFDLQGEREGLSDE